MLLMVAIGADSEPGIVAERLVPIVREHEVVVCAPEAAATGLVSRLRALLPRHTVVAIVVPGNEPPIAEAALLQGLLDDGVVTVVVLPPTGAERTVTDLAQRLGADLSTTLDGILGELAPVV